MSLTGKLKERTRGGARTLLAYASSTSASPVLY